MTKVKNVGMVLKKMVELLYLDGPNDWANALDKCHEEIINDPSSTASKIRAMYGGMGSLNDIVVYRNGQLLMAENDEFDALRLELYQICHSIS